MGEPADTNAAIWKSAEAVEAWTEEAERQERSRQSHRRFMAVLLPFAEQDESYRDSVLPPACRARVAVEAAARLGWDRWIGPDGAFLGMHTFGASGPATDVYEHFGITADRAAELGRQVMEATGARAAG